MDRNSASSRLQGYLIHESMLRQGVDSKIVATHFQLVSSPFNIQFIKTAYLLRHGNFTHAVFVAPEWSGCQLSLIWKQWGGISICVRCDNVPGQYDRYFDKTILPTSVLADSLLVKRRCIISDHVEVPSNIFKTDYSVVKKIKVVWVGHQNYGEYITKLIESLKSRSVIDQNFVFTVISKGAFANKQWDIGTIFSDILEHDVAFIPIPSGEWFASKSANRLAMMMALGMPIVASRIASYAEIGRDGRNVRFFDDEDSMVSALQFMLEERNRSKLGIAARDDLGDQFSIERIGPLWTEAILGTVNARDQMSRPPISARLFAALLGF
jgi:hypothetical protein